jgi:ankyrin repeat protein
MPVIGFLHSLMNNPRLVAASPQGLGVGYVRRNAREAAISCALGLVMFAYLATFVPYKHWGHVIRSETGVTPMISEASETGVTPEASETDVTASIPEVSETGVTPLISEASANRPKAVRFLLARGASKYAKTNEGFTAFDFAAYNKNESMARLLWTSLSGISDSALKAAMDESYSRMTWSVCQFLLSQTPEQDALPRNVFQTDIEVETSSLSPQERISRCRGWVSRNQIPQSRNALSFDKAQSLN